MTIPPALTWTHLFPSDVAYDCVGGPSWFREWVDGRDIPGQRPVLIARDRLAADLPDLDPFFGLVAINCSGLSDKKLRGAGFVYVRRFAILPSIADARWFIPLDTPAISSAAFSLYKPIRVSARAKHLAARAAARASLPFWYRDQICIAQRAVPALELALQAPFVGCGVRLALSSGAPEPARNRKPSVLVLGPGGRTLAFAKLANSPLARHLVRHEAEILSALTSRPGLDRVAPRLLFAGEVEGTYINVQTPIDGHPVRPELTPGHRRLLETMWTAETKPAAATTLVSSVRARIASLLPLRTDLLAILDGVTPVLERLILPVTIVHGDFAPWNLREHHGAVAAFDWEYAELEGLPLLDELNHLLLVGYLFRGWTVERAYNRLLSLASSAPLGLSPDRVRALQSMHILDVLLRFLSERPNDSHPMVAWYQRLLGRLAAGSSFEHDTFSN